MFYNRPTQVTNYELEMHFNDFIVVVYRLFIRNVKKMLPQVFIWSIKVNFIAV